MDIFEFNECAVLTWDQDQRVYGLNAARNKQRRIEITGHAVSESGAEVLAVNLAAVIEQLAPSEDQLIIAGGELSGSICFDLEMPKMAAADLKQAISYELTRHIPLDTENLILAHRIISPGPDAGDNSRQLVRIIAMEERQWNELITEFTSAGLKVDFIIHPFLVVDPLLAEEESVFLPTIEKSFSFKRAEEKTGREMVFAGSPETKELTELSHRYQECLKIDPYPLTDRDADGLAPWSPALLLAAYGLSAELHGDRGSFTLIPRELFPERFRGLRRAFIALAAIAAILTLVLIGRYWWEARQRLKGILDEQAKVKVEIGKYQQKNEELVKIDEVAEAVNSTKLGNGEIVHCLHRLTTILPKEMWIYQFSSRDNYIDLNIRSNLKNDKNNSISKLNSGYLKTKQPHERRNPDGSLNIYLKLEYMSPVKRSKKKN